MTDRDPIKVGNRVIHTYMPGMWKGEVIAIYGGSYKVRWDTTPRRETWVAAEALARAHGEQASKQEDGK